MCATTATCAARISVATVTRFGRLDVAVNNAGTGGQARPADRADRRRAITATFDTSNVLGTVLSLKHEMRVMQALGSRQHHQISSSMGHKGAPGASIYTASKHAVEGLTKAAALLEGVPSGFAGQRRRAGPGRNGDVGSFYRQCRRRNGPGCRRPARNAPARRRRSRRPSSFFTSEQCIVRHRSDRFGGRRQVRSVRRPRVSRADLRRFN